MPQFDRRFLALPAILVLWFLFQPGGYLDRQRFFQLHRHAQGNASAEDAAIAVVASDIAGRRVEVRCTDLTDARSVEPLGQVEFVLGKPVDYMKLRPDVCTWLAQLRRNASFHPCASGDDACFVRAVRTVEAITAVAHEAYHLRGIADEAKTQCYAVQRFAATAERFGIARRTARGLARFGFDVMYPRLPEAYRTADCRPGGPLDLRTGSPWS